MKKFYNCLFFILAMQPILAQDTYYKSSIITNKNDTLKGFISSIFDPKSLKFKTNMRGKAQIFMPSNIKSFILDGNIFESRVVHFSQYKYDNALFEGRLMKDEDGGFITDTFFLQKLIKGNINFYKLKIMGKSTYYFVEKNGQLKELPPQYYSTKVRGANNDSIFAYQNIYNLQRGQSMVSTFTNRNTLLAFDYLDTLYSFMSDKGKILPINYTEKNLKLIVLDYNKKSGITNGGLLKNDIRKKIFVGASLGIIRVLKDNAISDGKTEFTFSGRLYGLMPLYGLSRYVSVRGGLNYYIYQNTRDRKQIVAASIGMRLATLSGFIRPYGEISVAAAQQFWNRGTYPIVFPTNVEAGILVPIGKEFITLGCSLTPVRYTSQNGFRFFNYHIGLMF